LDRREHVQPDAGHHKTHGKSGNAGGQAAEKSRCEKQSDRHVIHRSLPKRSDQRLDGDASKGEAVLSPAKLAMSGVAYGHSAIVSAPAKGTRRSAWAECLETPGDCNSARPACYVGRQQKNQG